MRPALGRSTDASEIGRINRLVEFAKSSKAVWPILDYGCGNMIVTHSLAIFGRPVYGVDAYDLPYNNGPYPTVTCFDVLEHCENPAATLSDISRRMDDRGRLIMTVPNRWWLFETHASRPWNRLVGFNWGPWRYWLRRKVGRNVPCYTKDEIGYMLQMAGFDIVDIGYQVAPLDNAPWLRKLVWNWHTTKIPFFAVDIYVVGVKRG